MSIKSWEISYVGGSRASEQGYRTGVQNRRQPPDQAPVVFRAELSGFNEVPPVLTDATGTFEATVAQDGRSIQYELTYANLSTPSLFAHIHFGQPGVNGEVMAFLCGGGDKPACPVRGGSVTGTIDAGDILAIPSQGLAAGDLAGALRIIGAGAAYVNVHSTAFPEGEIRGQIV